MDAFNHLTDAATLGEALQRQPFLLPKAQAEATRLYAAACRRFNDLTRDHHAVWAQAKQATAAGMIRPPTWRYPADDAPGLAQQFRAALWATAFYGDLASLTQAEAAALVSVHGQLATYPEGRAVAARYPALAEWMEHRDADHARLAEADEARRRTDAAAALAAAPQRLLEALRARGVELTLAKGGNIAAPAGASLTAEDLAALKVHKPAIVAILAAEAEALAPQVVA